MSRSQPVLPYRVLPPYFVKPEVTGWSATVDGAHVACLSDKTPFSQWDANLRFVMKRDFRIEGDVAEAVGINPGENCCELIVAVTTAGSLHRAVLFRQPVTPGGWSDISVEIAPDSTRLAREMIITSGLFLSRNISSADQLAPSLSGSRLWETTERIRLEGGRARLPMYEVQFSKAFVGEGMDQADYHVEIADEPDLEIEAALTVYLNADRKEFVEDVSRGGSVAEARLWRGIVRRALIDFIRQDDVLVNGAPTPGSLRHTIERWAQQIWPHMQRGAWRNLPTEGYSRFEAQIDSWFESISSRVGEGR